MQQLYVLGLIDGLETRKSGWEGDYVRVPICVSLEGSKVLIVMNRPIFDGIFESE
jgi:hypothetical protein